MKKLFYLALPLLVLISFLSNLYGQQKSKFVFEWDSTKVDKQMPQREVLWLLDSLNNEERTALLEIVSSLSSPSAAQLIPSYFIFDGGISRAVRPFVDSLSLRPQEGKAGIIRVAYLSARVRKLLLGIQERNKIMS